MARTIALGLVVFVALAGTAATGVAGRWGSSSGRSVSLAVAFWPDERDADTVRRWTLRCNPVGGTLPTRTVACRRLARLDARAFAPVPDGALCTQLYGGPQKAVVKGTLGERRIWASFRRRDGCEIDRWQRFSPWLLPPGGVTG